MAKKIKQPQKGYNQEEIGAELNPIPDQEIATEFPYNEPQQGMNKKQQQQEKK